MVVGYRNMDDKNGRRSRGQSPNGHLSEDCSGSEDSDHENGMRVGEDYQVSVPTFNPGMRSDARAEAMLVWAPHPELTEVKLDEYIHVAKEKHSYNVEQALGMLFWHKHNVDKALADLPNFTPFPDEWTVEDKVLFEQAFSFHGKSFHRIRQMLPDKSIASLVKYYYSWKKTRSRTSLMDRQARKLTIQRDDSEEDVEDSGNSDSDIDSASGQTQTQTQEKPCPASKKSECAMPSSMRMKNKRKPPRGMYLNHEDMIALATGPPGQGEAILKQLDTELVALKRQVQNNKQLLSMQKQKSTATVEDLRPPENLPKISPRWSNEELLLAVQGVRKYGKDFRAIAEVIGNKTEAHIRSFFVNYRRRYNLDEVLGEYEKEHGGEDGSREGDAASTDELQQMEVDTEDTTPLVNGDNSTAAAADKETDNTDKNTSPPSNSKQPPALSISPTLPAKSTPPQQQEVA